MNTKEDLILRLNIEKYLEKKGINQNQLSLDGGYVSKLLNGKVSINPKNLEIIANDLDVSIEQLTDPSDFNRFSKYMDSNLHLYNSYHETGKSLIRAKSSDLLEALKEDGINGVVYNVLIGGNVRDITEFITRNRLLLSNGAILKLLHDMEWEKSSGNEEYLEFLGKMLETSSNNDQRILALWLLGLTQKGLDNIVRGRENLYDYIDKFQNTLDESLPVMQETFGNIEGSLTLNGKTVNVDWNFLNLLFTAIGAQTLTIRGSSKSMNGKLFEKLVLGAALSMFGFKYCKEIPTIINPEEKLFWLSSTEENERETDATIVFNQRAISIDIGFIGKGNPEIASDKITRFRSSKEIGKIDHLMCTIVIVDTIGNNSNLTSIAEDIEGSAIEMKDKLWMKKFAEFLADSLGCDCYLEHEKDENVHDWISLNLEEINLQDFL